MAIQEILQFSGEITAKWRNKLPMFIWQSGKVLLSMRMHQSDLCPVSSMQENTRNSTVGRENHSKMVKKMLTCLTNRESLLEHVDAFAQVPLAVTTSHVS